MRLRPFRAVRRAPLKAVQVLPTMVTAGNLLAGLLAISYLQDAAHLASTDEARASALTVKAAWMVFLGMFCDALDGRIARLTRTSSAFGAQLDSLADVVSFGVAPAMLMKTLVQPGFPMLAPKVVIALAAVYMLGAGLRLARYNVETARTSAAGENHATLVFRGIPSPAAAGVIASLVILKHEYDLHGVDWALLVAAPLLGVLMVSRLPYAHVLNRWFDGTRPFSTVVLLALTLFFGVLFFHETVAAAFGLYALSGPVVYAVARLTGRPGWALGDEVDEEDLAGAEAPDPDASREDAPSTVRRG